MVLSFIVVRGHNNLLRRTHLDIVGGHEPLMTAIAQTCFVPGLIRQLIHIQGISLRQSQLIIRLCGVVIQRDGHTKASHLLVNGRITGRPVRIDAATRTPPLLLHVTCSPCGRTGESCQVRASLCCDARLCDALRRPALIADIWCVAAHN